MGVRKKLKKTFYVSLVITYLESNVIYHLAYEEGDDESRTSSAYY